MDTSFLVASETLMEELGIKKDAYYRDLKFLDIEIIKDNSGKSFISSDDARRIKSLREWMDKSGTRRGFDDTIANENSEQDSGLNNNNSRHNSTDNSALIKSNENSSSLKTQNDEEEIYVTPEEPTDNMNIDGLVREAAELKAREVAMPSLVKRAIADKMTEDDLPEDLKEKVNLAREAANPKFTPSMVADKILERYRQGKVG